MNFKITLISFLMAFLPAYMTNSAEFSQPHGPFFYEINGYLIGDYYEYANNDRVYNFYRDSDGNTILHQAVSLGHARLIDSLLESVASLPLLMSVNKQGARPVDICCSPEITAHINAITHARLSFEKTRAIWRMLPRMRVTEINNILSLKEYIGSLGGNHVPILLILNFDREPNASGIRRADFLVGLYFQHIKTLVSDTCTNPVQRFEVLDKYSKRSGFYGNETPVHVTCDLYGTLYNIYSNERFCCAKKNGESAYDRAAIAAYYFFREKIKNFGTIIFVTDTPINTYRFIEDALLLGLTEESVKPFLLER